IRVGVGVEATTAVYLTASFLLSFTGLRGLEVSHRHLSISPNSKSRADARMLCYWERMRCSCSSCSPSAPASLASRAPASQRRGWWGYNSDWDWVWMSAVESGSGRGRRLISGIHGSHP
ncbi:hypothetical protein CPB84DRAFT_1785706, partial [Gymnopilus junonius]